MVLFISNSGVFSVLPSPSRSSHFRQDSEKPERLAQEGRFVFVLYVCCFFFCRHQLRTHASEPRKVLGQRKTVILDSQTSSQTVYIRAKGLCIFTAAGERTGHGVSYLHLLQTSHGKLLPYTGNRITVKSSL